MDIDNSRGNAFRTCPWLYYEQFERDGRGVQSIPKPGDPDHLELGSRVHELMEEHYLGEPGKYPPYPNPKLEEEAQWIRRAYIAHYPNDRWQIIDVERTFRVPLPELCPDCYSAQVVYYPGGRDMICNECAKRFNHRYHHVIGKIDLFIRDLDSGKLYIIDHKTEKRGSKSHTPQKLAMSDQASLYLYAARLQYPDFANEELGFFYNILVRPSEAGREGPSFRRADPEYRNAHDIEIACRDLVITADDIERYKSIFANGEWPADRQRCIDGWKVCEMYKLHKFGEDPQLVLKHEFQPRKEYLDVTKPEVATD